MDIVSLHLLKLLWKRLNIGLFCFLCLMAQVVLVFLLSAILKLSWIMYKQPSDKAMKYLRTIVLQSLLKAASLKEMRYWSPYTPQPKEQLKGDHLAFLLHLKVLGWVSEPWLHILDGTILPASFIMQLVRFLLLSHFRFTLNFVYFYHASKLKPM